MAKPVESPAPPPPESLALALALVEEGQRALSQGDYARGIEVLRRARDAAAGGGDRRLEARVQARLASALEGLGRLSEAVETTLQALQGFREAGEDRELVITLYSLGHRYLLQGRVEESIQICIEAVERADRLQDGEQSGHALINLGNGHLSVGALSEARRCYRKARSAFEQAANEGGAAAALNALGAVLQAREQPGRARVFHREALRRATGAGVWTARFDALMNLGQVAFSLGDAGEACDRFGEALREARGHGHRVREGLALRNVAVMEDNQGHLEEAARRYEEALAIFEAIGHAEGRCEMLRLYINCTKRTADPARGWPHRRLALRLARRHAPGAVLLELLDNVAEIAFKTGRWPRALDYWENALRLSRRLDLREREVTFLEHLRYMYMQSGRPDLALEPAQELVDFHRSRGRRLEEAWAMSHLTDIWTAMGIAGMAAGVARKALALFEEEGVVEPRLEAILRGNLGNALLSQGEAEEARRQYAQALALQRKLADGRGEGLTLRNMSVAYRRLGEVEKAEACERQAARCREEDP